MATPKARMRPETNKAARSTPPRDLLNYRLGKRIGQDELASLYHGTHLTLDRPVHIAVLRRSDWVSVSRFQLAMHLGARLSHSNILPVIDAGHDDSLGDYMVMPRLETRSLADILSEGPLEPLLAMRIFTQISAALEFLHEQSIIHRDIQPANILVTPQGTAYLANFSLAASPETPDFSGMNEADYRTLYTAPEQDVRSNRIEPAQDLYSLGALAYHMFSGQAPPLPPEVAAPLSAYTPTLASVDRIIQRLLAVEPAQRYPSASQASMALNQSLRDLRDEATEDMQEANWEPTAEWLDNPLELAFGDRLDQTFVQNSRARANELHRVDTIKRQLDRWGRKGALRRRHYGQEIQAEQIVSYNIYTYVLRAHYERRTEPKTQQQIYKGSIIDPSVRSPELWDVPVPEYEPFVDMAPEPIVIPGSRKLVTCPECNGVQKLDCPTCSGTGQVKVTRRVEDANGKIHNESFQDHCKACHGYGKRPCPRCDGHGQLQEESSFTISRFGKIHTNEDDISGLHRLTIETLAKPVFEGRIDPYEPQWNQVAPLKELLEGASQAGGKDARILAADLIIKGVPITEVDYRYQEKPHTLALLGFENAIRGDSSLIDRERLLLYGLIGILVIILIVFALMQLR